MHDVFKKTGVLILGAAFSLLLLESGLRILHVLQQNRSGRLAPGAVRTVLCVGDSFVYGLGAPPDKSFPSQLQQLLGTDYAVINMGLGGQNTTDVLQGLRKQIQAKQPDVVIILCGSANLWNMRGSENYLRTASRWSRLCAGVFRTRTGRLAKLLFISLKGKHPSQAAGGKPGGRDREPKPAALPKREWTKMPEFRDCTQAEIAVWRNTYEKGIRSKPAEMSNYQGLGLICLADRDYDRAVTYFRTAVRLDPSNTRNYLELGKAYDEMGRHDEALAALRRVIEIEPNEYLAYGYLGYVYQHMSRDADALRAFRRCLELTPVDDESRFKGVALMSRAAQDAKTRTEARQLLREYGQDTEAEQPSLMRLISDADKVPPAALARWIRGDIGEMIEICRERGADVILMNYPTEFEDVSGVLGDIAQEYSLPFADNSSLFGRLFGDKTKRRSDYFVPDGHCNAAGYGLMAGNVYDVMLRNGYAKQRK